MKKWLMIALIQFFLVALTLGQSQTQANVPTAHVPSLVKFAGVLNDDAGHPKTGVVGITFALYKDQQGGAPLWLETQNVQADASGRYTVMLGSTKSNGLPLEFFSSNEARWVGVQPQGQNEQPRVLLVSAPYALKAADAETLGGKPLSAFQLAAPQSSNSTTQNPLPPAEQPNEITCASKTGCKAASVPVFTSNGGSAKVSDSIITQTGGTVNISGGMTGQTGFFRSSNNGAIFQATQTSNGAGIGIAGVAEGNTGIGVEGSGVTGVSGFGLSNGIGVAGQGGTGVFGFSSPTTGFARATVGVLNTNVAGSAGVYGVSQNSSGQTFGVQGYNFSNGNFSAGVSAVSSPGSGITFGLSSVSNSPNGTGTLGLGQGFSNTGSGFLGCCSFGVWGDTSSSVFSASGLMGTADNARAIYLQNNSTQDPTAFMFNAASGQFALQAGGGGGFCTVDTTGHLHCDNALSVVAPVDRGQRRVALYAVESPQNWFEDFGSGQLASGTARITLDQTFAQAANADVQYHVFLTPREECEGLYVSNATATGFEVHELHHGNSSVAFDYRIVALRRGFENVRLEDMTEKLKRLEASQLKPMPGQRVALPSVPPPQKLSAPVTPSQRNVAAISVQK